MISHLTSCLTLYTVSLVAVLLPHVLILATTRVYLAKTSQPEVRLGSWSRKRLSGSVIVIGKIV
jgi:hypothetical protein